MERVRIWRMKGSRTLASRTSWVTTIFLVTYRQLRGRLCATKAQRGEESSEQLCCMRDEGWPLGVGV